MARAKDGGAILVPVDGSAFGEAAVAAGSVLARRLGAVLHVVHVHVPSTLLTLPQYDHRLEIGLREQEARYLASLGERAAATGIPGIRTELLDGPVVPALEAYAVRAGIDLIVMSTHGRGGVVRAWLGSVADGLVRRATVPVLLVQPERAPADLGTPPTRVLVPLDGSPLAEEVLPHALRVLGAGAEVVLCRIVPPPVVLGATASIEHLPPPPVDEAEAYLLGVATRLRAQGVAVAVRSQVAPHPGRAVLALAEEAAVDVIAMATHGRGGFSRLLLGSVADKVLRGARVPILLCRPAPAHSATNSAANSAESFVAGSAPRT
jgi:nucleotide-binding universal stress UspA family protein